MRQISHIYHREQARRYAERWWNDYNPHFRKFTVDCTNYVSQCLYAGGFPMQGGDRRDRGWWYRRDSKGEDNWSYSWAVAHSLHWYLAGGDTPIPIWEVHRPQELAVGDVICYDWSGNGTWEHTTIVTDINSAGHPLVNAHTVNSRLRAWHYRDSHAWTPRTRYKFFHIEGYLARNHPSLFY